MTKLIYNELSNSKQQVCFLSAVWEPQGTFLFWTSLDAGTLFHHEGVLSTVW